MIKITELIVYPIKSLGGISLTEVKIVDTGFEYDRFWMLVDELGNFISQRIIPKMALFSLSFSENYLEVTYDNESIQIPLILDSNNSLQCFVWNDETTALKEDDDISEWFSKILGQKVYLVRKAKTPKRVVKNHTESAINFSDSSQFLFLGEKSLEHLNSKMEYDIKMNRFRPNIVFEGGTAYCEDLWKRVKINDTIFESTKPCARCKITTINQETAEIENEPLRTLSKYRKTNNKVFIGQFYKLVESQSFFIKNGSKMYIQ